MLFVTTLNTPECGMTGNLAGFVGLAPKSSYPAGWSGAIRLLAVTVWASSGSNFLNTRIKSLPSRLTLQFPSPPHSPFSVPDSQRCPGFAGSALPRPSKLNP
jgi:hypothetical protein